MRQLRGPHLSTSRNGSVKLVDRARYAWDLSVSSRSTPRQTRWSPHSYWPVLKFLLLLFCCSLRRKVFGVGVEFVRVGRFCRVRPGGHLIGRFCRRSSSPCPRRPHSDPCRLQVRTGCLATHPGLLLDAPQRPSQSPRATACCFFLRSRRCSYRRRLQCLAPESTSRALFSLAGFQVTLIGRFWVTAEGHWSRCWCTLNGAPRHL